MEHAQRATALASVSSRLQRVLILILMEHAQRDLDNFKTTTMNRS